MLLFLTLTAGMRMNNQANRPEQGKRSRQKWKRGKPKAPPFAVPRVPQVRRGTSGSANKTGNERYHQEYEEQEE
jgi:hypothetical protein